MLLCNISSRLWFWGGLFFGGGFLRAQRPAAPSHSVGGVLHGAFFPASQAFSFVAPQKTFRAAFRLLMSVQDLPFELEFSDWRPPPPSPFLHGPHPSRKPEREFPCWLVLKSMANQEFLLAKQSRSDGQEMSPF